MNERIRLERQENERLRLELAKNQSVPKKDESKPESKDAGKEPNPDDYDTFAAYNKAYTNYLYEQKEIERAQKERDAKLKDEYEQKTKSFQQKINEFSKTVDDFDEVIEDAAVSFPVEEAIRSSDIGPQLMYELGKDRDLLDKLNKLDPISAYREIGKLEAKLAKESEKPKQKTITKAPAPINPIGSKSSSKAIKNPEDMSFDEFKKWRRGE